MSAILSRKFLTPKDLGKQDQIISAVEQNGWRIRRFPNSERNDVDEELLKCFKQKRDYNVPVSGSIIVTKAEEYAKRFSDEEFVSSAGWVDRFMLHHISFRKVSGGARGVKSDTITEWFNALWPSVR